MIARDRQSLALILALAAALLSSRARAQAMPLPVELQARLLSRVVSYDRGFKARAGDAARVLVVLEPGDPESERTGKAMAFLLAGKEIAGLRAEVSVMPLADPTALADRCRAEQIAIVYLAPGLDMVIGAIGRALKGVDVLSVAAVPSYVGRGAVLGFDITSGRPQMLLHLPQALAQSVNLSPDVLGLMKVIK